jgi:LytS/YehU family sensor histidine kinase
MIVQPFVENAIKHGMRNSDGTSIRGKIELHFEDKKQYILCTIIDNGIGREKAAELNKLSKETYHRSTALNVTQERLELMSDEEQSKAIEIIDLYENNLPCGTKVILRIPTI